MSQRSDLLLIAARARASGLSWKATADLVKKSETTVQCWRNKYAIEWNRLYELAQRETQNEAGAEAVAVLRNQVRSKDVKIAYAAAKALLVWFSRPIKPVNTDQFQTDLDRAVNHVTRLSRGACKALNAEVREITASLG